LPLYPSIGDDAVALVAGAVRDLLRR
jgi:hypothetical protein